MRKRFLAWGLVLLVLAGIGAATAAGGAEDPLLSVSYLYDTCLSGWKSLFAEETEAAYRKIREDFVPRLAALEGRESDSPWSHASGYLALELQDGGSVSLAPFSRFLLSEGTAMLHVPEGEVLDLTEGRVCRDGELLSEGHRYFAAEESEGLIRFYSSSLGFVDGDYVFRKSDSFPAAERFLDIASHWGRDRIITMTELGLVSGMEPHYFEPERKVTRAMFVTILGRYHGVPADYGGETAFPDVAEGDWFAPYVRWASLSGLVLGFDDGSFGPGLEITREQMALLLIRYCDAWELRLPETAEDSPFADEERISPWALEAVHRARRLGLVSGRDDGSFDPGGTATRAEMCAIFCNLMDRVAAAGEETLPETEAAQPEETLPEAEETAPAAEESGAEE